MLKLSTESKVYLADIRCDERFVKLVNEITVPDLPSFYPGKNIKEGLWQYWSGKKDGVISIVSMLKGVEVLK